MIQTEDMRCPSCGTKTMQDSGGIFYERGAFDGNSYAEEGNLSSTSCATCSMEIAIVAEPIGATIPVEIDEADPSLNLLEALSRCATMTGPLGSAVLCVGDELLAQLRAYVTQHRPVPYVYNGGKRYRSGKRA